MARRFLKEKLTHKNQIKEKIYPIKDSDTDYITKTGKIYKDYGNNMYYPKSVFVNHHNGYVYTNITYLINGKHINKQRRVHILLAETFLPNPNNYPVVMHKDNNKENNNLNNLKWGTISENTQQAVDDGLLCNDKGYEDSQSIPVIMYDSLTRKEVKRFGSMCEASRYTGYDVGLIKAQATIHTKNIRLKEYFRLESDGNIDPPRIVIQYDYDTDKEINRFLNSGDASKKTGIADSTINTQCNNNTKPKYKSRKGTYFLYG